MGLQRQCVEVRPPGEAEAAAADEEVARTALSWRLVALRAGHVPMPLLSVRQCPPALQPTLTAAVARRPEAANAGAAAAEPDEVEEEDEGEDLDLESCGPPVLVGGHTVFVAGA